MVMEHAVDQDGALRLSVRLLPEDATYPEVEWESSNPEVISVSGGTMEIRGTGDVVLTAVSHDGTKDSIRLKVVSRGRVNGAIGFAAAAAVGILFLLALIAGKRLQAAKKRDESRSSELLNCRRESVIQRIRQVCVRCVRGPAFCMTGNKVSRYIKSSAGINSDSCK